MSVYVTFDIRAVEDREATKANGHYSTKDVDFAILRIPGDKHTVLEQEVTPEKITYWKNTPHLAHIPTAYDAWKKGLDAPVSGIPLREWPIISPAQLQQALAIGIRTVEDFASLHEEGLRAFGIGGQVLKQKAKTYLESAASHGKVVERMTAQDEQIKLLTEQIAAMKASTAAKPAAKAPAKKPAAKPAANGATEATAAA